MVRCVAHRELVLETVKHWRVRALCAVRGGGGGRTMEYVQKSTVCPNKVVTRVKGFQKTTNAHFRAPVFCIFFLFYRLVEQALSIIPSWVTGTGVMNRKSDDDSQCPSLPGRKVRFRRNECTVRVCPLYAHTLLCCSLLNWTLITTRSCQGNIRA